MAIDSLDGNGFVEVLMTRTPHLTYAASPDLLFQDKVANLLSRFQTHASCTLARGLFQALRHLPRPQSGQLGLLTSSNAEVPIWMWSPKLRAKPVAVTVCRLTKVPLVDPLSKRKRLPCL